MNTHTNNDLNYIPENYKGHNSNVDEYIDRDTIIKAIEILCGKKLKWYQRLDLSFMIWFDSNRIKMFFGKLFSSILIRLGKIICRSVL